MLFINLLIILCNIINIKSNLIYPVNILEEDGKNKLFVIYQKNINEKELWSIDTTNKKVEKNISFFLCPLAIKILPGNIGFSFINNNKLKIKYFHKRSVKSIQFDDVLNDFTDLEWINDKVCYFSAKRYNRNVIMIYNIDGHNLKIIEENNFGESLKPQKFENKLFYIVRSDKLYSIFRTNFLNPFEEDDQNNKIIEFKEEDNLAKIIDFQEKPIVFLKVFSKESGFFAKIENFLEDENVYTISYNKFTQKDLNWDVEKLFTFKIKNINDCFNKNLDVFMPHHFKNQYQNDDIFFTNLDDNENMNIFNYCNSKITQQTFSINQHLFAPFLVKDKFYYGKFLAPTELELLLNNNFEDVLESLIIKN